MATWNKEFVRERIAMWMKAEEAVATGQEYRIGTRYLRRADLKEIRDQITFWRRELAKLENRQRGARVMRVVPRDL